MDTDASVDLEISADGLSASIVRAIPARGGGRPLTADALADHLSRRGIVVGVDREAIQTAVNRLGHREDVRGITLARGEPSKDPVDGRLDLSFRTERSVGEATADGRIDFHERHAIQTVKAGDVLARVHPPVPGSPGRDVFGQPIVPREGRVATLRTGQNVELTADGSEYRAKIDGMVSYANEVLSVTEVFEHRGDVDLSSGNLRVDRGSLVIKGTVRSGFSVTVEQNLTVGEAIESATIVVGGDVQVGRGVLMQEGDGRIQAGGSVHARFAQNAKIVAGGDLVIDNDLTRCEVRVAGRLIATAGKGRILGGKIRCGGGIEAREIGSEAGTPTHIHLGLERIDQDALLEEKETHEALVKKIEAAIGTREPREILQRTPPEKREAVVELLKKRQAALERCEEIVRTIQEEKERIARESRLRIKVSQTIHPGTWIYVGDHFLEVRRAIHAGQVFLDHEQKLIRHAPL